MKYYTVEQVAEIFQVKRVTVYRWIKNKSLTAIKLSPKCYRVSEHAIHLFYDPWTTPLEGTKEYNVKYK